MGNSPYDVNSVLIRHDAARIFDYWGVYDDYNLGDEPENDLLLAIFQDWLTMEDDAHAALTASSGVHPE